MTSRKNTAGAAVQAQRCRSDRKPQGLPTGPARGRHAVCLVVIEGRLVTLPRSCGKKPDRKAASSTWNARWSWRWRTYAACAPTH